MDSTSNIDIPLLQLQRLIPEIINDRGIQACSAQALGSEIYVGCSNGELLRFAVHTSDSNTLESYTLLSSQRVLGDRPIDEVVLIPCLSRALVLSDQRIHFYSIPSLELLPIKPIRHVVTFAVDDHHLKRLPPSASAQPVDAVDFCVIKRMGIALYAYTQKDRLGYIRDVALPQVNGVVLAKQAGKTL